MQIQDFQWSTRSSSIFNVTYSIPSINSSWSTFLKNYSISQDGVYEWDIIFNNNGRQKFECSCDDDGYLYIDGEFIGDFSSLTSSEILTTERYYNSGTTHRITIKRSNTNAGPTAVACRWTDFVYSPVKIDLFKASPNPVQGGIPSGTPSSTTTLQWDVLNAKEIFIDNNIGIITNPSDTLTIDTKLQSIVEETKSPATKTYKLTAVGFASSDILEKTVTVAVYNDNTPENFYIPPFYNLDPAEQVIYSLGQIDGIDMPTLCLGSPGLTLDVNADGAFSGSKLIDNNDAIRIRFSSPEFNTSKEGLTNSTEFWVQIGTIKRYFTVTTRAPNTAEIFDYGDISEAIPYPRPEGNDPNDGPSTPYLVSPTTISVNDVELADPYGVELKTTLNTIAEVRYKNQDSSWSEWVHPNNIYGNTTSPPPRVLDNLVMNPIAARSGNVSNPTPNLIQTRSSGILTAKNVLDN